MKRNTPAEHLSRLEIEKSFKSRVSSLRIKQMLTENLKTLDLFDFSEKITYWNSDWGNMRDYIDSIDLIDPNESIDDLPF